MNITVARWRDWEGTGIEHLVLAKGAEDVVAESVLLGAAETGMLFAVRYRIRCDSSWRVRELSISLIGDARRFELLSDGAGTWQNDAGIPMPELSGAVDVDLTVTPFTNTLPIRRLDLAIGAAAEIVVVYVDLPNLTVITEPQRYTRIGDRRYRFESLDGSFTRDIEVDEHGLVNTYPGLFHRVL